MPDQGLRYLDALPNYLGSKRDQTPAIFRAVKDAGIAPIGSTFIDAFAGGCSVGLTAKALGFRVLANDLSPRSEAIGKAFLENRSTTLNDDDVAFALTLDPSGWFLPSLKHLPWPENARQLLASMCKAADTYDNPMKRHMMRAWMVKFATAISIYGQPRMSVHQRIRDRNWDAMSPGMIDRILDPQTKPRPIAQQTAKSMAQGVFSNGERNEMHRMDVLDFLGGVTGDVLYLDPPYPDTEGYGRNYVGIDSILENRELEPDEGRFAAADGWTFLGDVLAAAREIPVVILSLGAEVKHVSADDLTALVRDHGRTVTVETVEYGLLQSRSTTKSQRKKEHLLVAVNAVNG